jgi:hypothetical protein
VRGVVVDLAVEHQPQAFIFIGHGLVASREVDDAQAAEAQTDASVVRDVSAVGVGAAVA